MKTQNIYQTLFIGVLWIFSLDAALASNVAGIINPVVNEGHRSFEYRNAYDPDNHGFVQRVHYQQSVNDDLMWRGIVQSRKTNSSDNDFDFLQAELFWQLPNVRQSWQHGLRFDARLRSDGRPNLLGLHWMNQFALSETLSARFVVLTSMDIGSQSRSGVFLQSRNSLTKVINDDWSVSLELFNRYGFTSDLGAGSQSQQLGPAVAGKLGDGWRVFAGFLAGLNDASPDESFRFWLTKSF